jgi:hypothetical protein
MAKKRKEHSAVLATGFASQGARELADFEPWRDISGR